jgi:hypothetical protein
MAEVWSVKLTAADRKAFAPWLAKCQDAGAARNMNDAIRLAVSLASTIPTDQLPRMGAGK